MLKLNASFSKKVPADQEYSSKGYSATIEVELPDGLTQEQLQERIHNTFALVEASVESEIQNGATVIHVAEVPTQPFQAPAPQQSKKVEGPSPKQLKYVTDLVRESRYDTSSFLHSHRLNTVYELSRKQCSQLIDLIKNQQSQAA
jgi:hypothetical protein